MTAVLVIVMLLLISLLVALVVSGVFRMSRDEP